MEREGGMEEGRGIEGVRNGKEEQECKTKGTAGMIKETDKRECRCS